MSGPEQSQRKGFVLATRDPRQLAELDALTTSLRDRVDAWVEQVRAVERRDGAPVRGEAQEAT